MRRALAVILALLALAAATAAPGAAGLVDVTVDRSTPEHHLETFLTAVDSTVRRMEAREWARNYYDAWFYPALDEKQQGEADLLKKAILDSMDLSAVPEWRRESAGLETAFMLWEILKAEGIGKDAEFRKLREGLWVIPGTYIQVGALTSGMRIGDVVFTADTVANVPALYEAIIGPHGSPGFSPYRYFTETPGGLTPPRWAGIAYKLPGLLRWDLGSNTVFQWLIAALILAVVVLVPRAVLRLLRGRGHPWLVAAVVLAVLSYYATGIIID